MRLKTFGLALSLASLAAGACAQTRPRLPEAPDTGFFVRFEADGKKAEKKLYGFGGTYDHAILPAPDDDPESLTRRSLIIEVKSLKDALPVQAIKLWVHGKLQVRAGPVQTFKFTGPSFCTGLDGQPDHVDAEASYMRPSPGYAKPFNFTEYSPRAVMFDGNLDEDKANKESIGFQTQAKGTKGTYEGRLEITKVDTAQQIIEGKFEFDAARMINTRRLPTGEWQGRCDTPPDFRVDTVKVTRGEFRMHYCFDPMRPTNSRYCPGSLSPDAPR